MRYLHPSEERGSIVVSIAVARKSEGAFRKKRKKNSAAVEWLIGRSAGMSGF